MLYSRTLPLLLVLLLAACGAGGHARDDDAKMDAEVGDVALSAGTPDVALRLADAALERHPADVEALIHRGQALTELGRLDEARGALRKAVAGRPNDARALLALGRVQLPVDPAAAEAGFAAVARLDSRNVAAQNDLGIARDLQGHHAEAEAAYRAALAIQPEMVAARVNLALCLAMRGQGKEAIDLLRPIADAPEATRKIKEDYAAVLAMAGDREQAEHILSTNMAANDVAPALDVLASARMDGVRR